MINEENSPDLARPLAAVMSSGFFGFFAHAGFLQGLADLGLEPDAYAGSSSGALVAATAAGGVSPGDMLERFAGLGRREFWDPPPPARLLALALRGLRGMTGYLRGRALLSLLQRHLPAERFEDLARPCLVSTLDLGDCRRRIIGEGPLAPAVAASGAVPMLFEPVAHLGTLLADGGLVDKAPVLAAKELLGASTIIVHLLPSSSLEQPLRRVLRRRLTPIALERRGVDAAREEHYRDQVEAVRRQGVRVLEVRGAGYPRCGPRRLAAGPSAFAAARERTRSLLAPQL